MMRDWERRQYEYVKQQQEKYQDSVDKHGVVEGTLRQIGGFYRDGVKGVTEVGLDGVTSVPEMGVKGLKNVLPKGQTRDRLQQADDWFDDVQKGYKEKLAPREDQAFGDLAHLGGRNLSPLSATKSTVKNYITTFFPQISHIDKEALTKVVLFGTQESFEFLTDGDPILGKIWNWVRGEK